MKSDALPIRYTKDGLEFDDGSALKADVIVFATGFDHSMKGQVAEIFGPKIAEQMGDFWGLDKEGELKGAFKRCGRTIVFLPKMKKTLTHNRPCTFLPWRNSRSCSFLFEIHRVANQGRIARESIAAVREDSRPVASQLVPALQWQVLLVV